MLKAKKERKMGIFGKIGHALKHLIAPAKAESESEDEEVLLTD